MNTIADKILKSWLVFIKTSLFYVNFNSNTFCNEESIIFLITRSNL